MKNEKYSAAQIPSKSYEQLRRYCNENGYKIGKFLELLISKNCKLEEKRTVMKVTREES